MAPVLLPLPRETAPRQLCPELPPPDDAWPRVFRALRLSDLEARIVLQVLLDREQKDIALAVGVSEAIVYRSLQRIYIKLHIGSRLELKSRVRAEYLASVTGLETVAAH